MNDGDPSHDVCLEQLPGIHGQPDHATRALACQSVLAWGEGLSTQASSYFWCASQFYSSAFLWIVAVPGFVRGWTRALIPFRAFQRRPRPKIKDAALVADTSVRIRHAAAPDSQDVASSGANPRSDSS